MVVDTNPLFFGLTLLVSLVHSVFEFLAYKTGKYLFSPIRGLILEEIRGFLRIITKNFVL